MLHFCLGFVQLFRLYCTGRRGVGPYDADVNFRAKPTFPFIQNSELRFPNLSLNSNLSLS